MIRFHWFSPLIPAHCPQTHATLEPEPLLQDPNQYDGLDEVDRRSDVRLLDSLIMTVQLNIRRLLQVILHTLYIIHPGVPLARVRMYSQQCSVLVIWHVSDGVSHQRQHT